MISKTEDSVPKINNRHEIERKLLEYKYNVGYNATIHNLNKIVRYTPKVGNEGPFHAHNLRMKES